MSAPLPSSTAMTDPLPEEVLAGDALLRAEVFSCEQLERHARDLAAWHRIDQGKGGNPLLKRLHENEETIRRVFEDLRAEAALGHTTVPAGEWLLDNHHLVVEQITTVRRHLPRRYSRELPRLSGGEPAGAPRVYALALELISHADGRVDGDSLERFIAAYQQGAPLGLGELWAVPIMLRLALIENLRRVAMRIELVQRQRADAARWAERLAHTADENPSSLVIAIADLAREDRFTAGFVAELHRRLQGQNPSVGLVLQWLDQRLGERHLTAQELIRNDNQDLAADQIAVENAITSLRGMGSIDWRAFVERLSPVEAVLREDPAGIYAHMDFATRDRYRHAVELLGRRCRPPVAQAERAVAAAAVALARANPTVDEHDGADAPPTGHVGWWLIDGGRAELERTLAASQGLSRPRANAGRPLAVGWYAAAIIGLTLIGVLALVSAAGAFTGGSPLLAVALALLGALPVSQGAVTIVNWLATRLATPRRLPRLDLAHGIPATERTLVAVPTMLTGPDDAEALAEGLLVRHLANLDEHLVFALVTDFGDAPERELPGDAALLAQARAAITRLNAGHPAPGGRDRFLLLHRHREWNAADGVWMGRERKRGKLEDLNRLLLHGDQAPFRAIVGDAHVLAGVRNVITLDTDTRLPRDAARELVAAIAHPLVAPRIDRTTGLVRGGHAVLQPRAAIALTSARTSWFAALWSGEPGIDPYSRAVSDVYQDLFDAGSFIGKGIYRLDAFDRALRGRFPDNTILSHDLIEGAFARAGLISDVLVVEDHPARYLADIERRSRWVRGDWQLLPWLLPSVPTTTGRAPNPLAALDRWKIADNLRRSLVAPAQLLFLAIACLGAATGALPAAGAAVAALAALAIALLPEVLAGSGALHRPSEIPLLPHLARVGAGVARGAATALAGLAFLPYEAAEQTAAVVRTLWRMGVSRRGLLEWRTASDGDRRAATAPAAMLVVMAAAPVAGLAGLLLALWHPGVAAAVLPLALAWIAAPVLAWAISRPRREAAGLDADDRQFLALAARRTWRYFAEQVGNGGSWLPPDNVQDQPVAAVAHRTSPTNIGLGLLAELAAHDFGWQTGGALLRRTGAILDATSALERHRGHLLNWYDTRNGAPLPPRYVSTVDSGNLAAHLLVLAAGLRELAERPLDPAARLRGIAHTLRAAAAALTAEGGQDATAAEQLAQRLAAAGGDAAAALPLLRAVAQEVAGLAARHPAGDGGAWLAAAATELAEERDECETLFGWHRHGAIPASAAPLVTEVLQRPTLRAIAGLADALATHGAEAAALRAALAPAAALARGLDEHAEALAQHAEALALGMEWNFLLDPRSKLFVIGYHLDDARLDRSSYDLLASESRLGSFFAVATGHVPQEHWFHLGRQGVSTASGTVLCSWSGTMFEYLMPALVLPEERGTLLDGSNRAAVHEQMRYGRARGVPWGISESAYHLTDAALNWQYRAFGVPGLGLKRGLGEDLVVAPYASALALLVEPAAATANLRRLEELGADGRYGLCEAIDFTPGRLPHGTDHVVIRSWMVHHLGMALLSYLHVLHGAPMRRRFLADPRMLAHRLLLQERPAPLARQHIDSAAEAPEARLASEPALRVVANPDAGHPEIHLLSNGRYHVMVSASGGGASRLRDVAVTRWREDPTRDQWGPFVYLRDIDDGHTWSAAQQPLGRPAEGYEAIFTQARAEFRRVDHGIAAHTEIVVSPEDDIELRRLTLANRSDTTRRIEVTTYAEPVLAKEAADLAHPAFGNLFMETEALPAIDALLASRRPRAAGDPRHWLVHLLSAHAAHATVADGHPSDRLSWETSRATFLGRGRTPADPLALSGSPQPLSGTIGAVLDPVVALRRTVEIPPGGRVVLDIVYGVAATREAAIALAERYRDPRLADRALGLSWTHGQVVLAQIGATESEVQAFARVAGSLVHAGPHRRAAGVAIRRNHRTRSGLWSHGISGDLPVCLLRVSDGRRLDLVRQTLRAHAWWRAKGLSVDLVILVEDPSVYRQELTDRIHGTVAAGPDAGLVDRPGGVFIRRVDQLPEEDRHLLTAYARVVITDTGGTIAQFAERRVRGEPAPARLVPLRAPRAEAPAPAPAYDLQFFNGLGGFTRDGREYIIILPPGATTPAPWCNVLANPGFGTVVSERGAAYTWAENCHEFRLTPWRCDAVSDPAGEAVYLRDEETGNAWSPTPGPCRGRGTYVVRHGFGYSAFSSSEEAIACELHTWVDAEAPVKHLRLRLANRSRRPRKLSVMLYLEWTLAELRERSAMHLVTEHEEGVLYAVNPLHDEFASRCAFAAVSRRPLSWTCDRTEFLGRGGTPEHPAALGAQRLLGRAGAALDPCAALQVLVELDPGQEQEVVFTVGAGRDRAEARALAVDRRGQEAARGSLERVYETWKRMLGAVRVRTSDPALDVLANGWLPYQVIASRLYARSGFYQSGGAYGFRDQLQDAMALVHHAPHLLRAQLLRAAARQFRDGDVQHWWHPPAGRGVRTRISDDYLWLPYALCRYLDATGDRAILDVRLPFLDGPQVPEEQESVYDLPQVTDEQAPLYEHAVRAVLRGMRYGVHGLPLMGCGDWNDGMDRVGTHGKGESVWLGFFLADVLKHFAPLARAAGDDGLAERLSEEAAAVARRLDVHAWDGRWYLRAWFDDGTPLGTAQGGECRIDALPQAWAAITGATDAKRAQQAMSAVDEHLVRRADGLVQLFDPPFDRGVLEPGYIKGYVPGVRENGGQYTHAAVWTAMGFAKLGDGARALEVTRLINPVLHAADAEGVARWRGEPYVMAADVYRAPGHTGRAGWTWYTGSAGWMWRLLVESLLGLERGHDAEGPFLRLSPVTPASFGGYEIDIRHGSSRYTLLVRGGGGAVTQVAVDGRALPDGRIPLHDDGKDHRVEITRA